MSVFVHQMLHSNEWRFAFLRCVFMAPVLAVVYFLVVYGRRG